MYLSDFLEYVKKGDDIIAELYSGKMRRGTLVDYDEYAIMLEHMDNSLVYTRVVPLDEVELIDLITKIKVTKEDLTKKIDLGNDNKKSD